MGVIETLRRIFAASKESGEESQLDQKYHTRIVRVGLVFCVIGMIAGGVASVSLANEPDAQTQPTKLARLPLLGAATGFLFGLAIMCVFAPRAFMTGPVGQKWMKLIGTKSVLLARFACLVFGVLGLAVMFGLGWHTLQTLR